MNGMEIVAVIVLILAVIVLIYYYLLNSPDTRYKIQNHVPANAYEHMDELLRKNPEYRDINDSESMTRKIKVKLSGIDLSEINTDMFSSKIDEFLDAKSEDLINEWSLVTVDDLGELEEKFSKTAESVDLLDKDFNEFKKSSLNFQENINDKLSQMDKRIEYLENK